MISTTCSIGPLAATFCFREPDRFIEPPRVTGDYAPAPGRRRAAAARLSRVGCSGEAAGAPQHEKGEDRDAREEGDPEDPRMTLAEGRRGCSRPEGVRALRAEGRDRGRMGVQVGENRRQIVGG